MSYFIIDAQNIDEMNHMGFYTHDGKLHFRESEFRGLSEEDRQKLMDQLNAALAPIKESWIRTLKERLKNRL